MEITWLGHSCFRIRGKDVSIVVDPFDRDMGFPDAKVAADIVLISHDHPGHNNGGAISGTPRVLSGPGEYEIKGVPITGIATPHDGEGGRKRGRNVAWSFQVEDVNICHLGDLGSTLSTEQVEAIGNVDILLVPVGGHNTINATQATDIMTTLEPKVVIPMHYASEIARDDVVLDSVEPFLRQHSAIDHKPQPRYTITKANLPEDLQVVLLESRRPV